MRKLGQEGTFMTTFSQLSPSDLQMRTSGAIGRGIYGVDGRIHRKGLIYLPTGNRQKLSDEKDIDYSHEGMRSSSSGAGVAVGCDLNSAITRISCSTTIRL